MDKIMVSPILDWTTEEVWQFIKDNNLPINPCYEKDGRVGCMICPFAKRQQIEEYEKQYPKIKKTILKALQKYLNKKGGSRKFDSAEEYYEWWKSKKSVSDYNAEKRQLKMEL